MALPAISPYLDRLLTEELQKHQTYRKAAEAAAHACAVQEMSLSTVRQETIEERSQDLVFLRDRLDADSKRWDERLKRLDKWLLQVQELKRRTSPRAAAPAIQGKLQHIFQRTLPVQARFERRLKNLEARYVEIHQILQQWKPVLMEHLERSERFTQDVQWVSRVVYSQEQRLRKEHQAIQAALMERLTALRQSINQSLRRLESIQKTLDARQNDEPLLRSEIAAQRTSLEGLRQTYITCRHDILQDALVFEAARRMLSTIEARVRKVRCLEESLPKASLWARLINA